MRMMNRHLQKVVGTSKPVLSTMCTLDSRRRPFRGGAGWQSVSRSTAGGAWGPRASRFVDPVLEATHRPPPSSGGTSVADEDARMPKTHHPYLSATLGEAALRLPPELAQPLEAAFAAANEAPAPINLPGCLQRIQAGDAADGQPWPGPPAHPAKPWPPLAGTALRWVWCRCWSYITPPNACAWTGKRKTISATVCARG